MEQKIKDFIRYLKRHCNMYHLTLEEENRQKLVGEVAKYYGVDNNSVEVLTIIQGETVEWVC